MTTASVSQYVLFAASSLRRNDETLGAGGEGQAVKVSDLSHNLMAIDMIHGMGMFGHALLSGTI